MKLRILAVIVSFPLSFCWGQNFKNDKTITEAIAAQKQFFQVLMMQKWEDLPALLGDEMKYIHSFGRIDTKTEYMTAIKRFPAIPQWEHTNINVNCYKNTCVVFSDLLVTLTMPDNSTQKSQQHSVEVWHKRKKQWVMVSHQSTSFK
jgi:hypothetical protein